MGSPSQPSFSSSINAATTSTLSSSNSRRLHSDVHSTPNHESSSSDGTPLASLTPDPTPGAASSSRIVTRKGPVTKGSLSPSTSVSEEAHGKDDGGVPQRSPAEGTNSSSRTSSQDCLPQKSTPSEARTGNSGKKTKVISSFYRHSRNQEKISNASHSETKTKDAQKEPPPLSSLPEHPSTSTQPGLPPASSALPHFRCGCGGISCGKCSHWKALDWRGTLEYRAAWDVEVWKAVQVERFRRQLEENKAAALTELQRRVQKQEKIEEERLKEKRRQLEIKEKGIRSEEHRQLQQRRRLEEAEKELTTSRQQLLEAQKHAEEEIRIQVRRVNEDYEHKTLRLRDQVTAAEAHSRRLEERLAHSEADYLHLFEEFHRFRTEHVVHGTGMTSSATGNTAQNIDPSLANTPPSLMVEMMRSRHAEELRALEERLEARYEHELRKVRQQCADLMEKNTQLAGALARRREQLRQLREQQHVFHPVGGAQPPTSVLPAGRPSLPSEKEKNLLETGGKQAVVSLALSAELERLQRERHRLIYESGGALGEGDPVVDGLSRRIILLQTQLQLGAEYTKSRVIDEDATKRSPRNIVELGRWGAVGFDKENELPANRSEKKDEEQYHYYKETSLWQEATSNTTLPSPHSSLTNGEASVFPFFSPPNPSETQKKKIELSSGPSSSPSFPSLSKAGGVLPPMGPFPSVPYYGLGNTLTIYIGSKKELRTPSSFLNPPTAAESAINLAIVQKKGSLASNHTTTASSSSFLPSSFIQQIDRSLQQTVRLHGSVWWLGTLPIDKDPSFYFSELFSSSALSNATRDALYTEEKRNERYESDDARERVRASTNFSSSASTKLSGDSRWGSSTLRTDQFTKAMIQALQHISFLRVAANAIHSYYSCPHSENGGGQKGCSDHGSHSSEKDPTKDREKTALPKKNDTTGTDHIHISTFSSSSSIHATPLSGPTSRSFSCMTPHTIYYRIKGHSRWKDVTAMLGIENGQLLLFVCSSSRATQQHLTNAAIAAGVKKESLIWNCGALLLMEPPAHPQNHTCTATATVKREAGDSAQRDINGTGRPQQREVHSVLVMWNLLIFLPFPTAPGVLSSWMPDTTKTKVSTKGAKAPPFQSGSVWNPSEGIHRKNYGDPMDKGKHDHRDTTKKLESNPTSLLTEYQPMRITECDVILLASFALPDAQCITPQLRLVETQPMVTTSSSFATPHSSTHRSSRTAEEPVTAENKEENISSPTHSGLKRQRQEFQGPLPLASRHRAHGNAVTGYRYVWKLVGPIRIVHPYLFTHVIHTLVRRCGVGSFDIHYGCDDRLSAMPCTPSGGGVLGGVGSGSLGSGRYGAEGVSSATGDGNGIGFLQCIGRVAQGLGSSVPPPRGSATASSWHCCTRLSYGSWLSLQERESLGTSEVVENDAGEMQVEDYLEAEFTVTRIVFKNISISAPPFQGHEASGCLNSQRSDASFLPPFFLELARHWSGWDDIPVVSAHWNNNTDAHLKERSALQKWCSCAAVENSMIHRWGAYFCSSSATTLFIHSFFFPHQWPPGFQLWKRITRIIDAPNEP